jgi:BirA family biotin operon repressor/biotin-[acetyl-CoA-carboxylase] ligase
LLGLGLNVNWNPEGAAGVLSPPTSLRAEAGRPVSRERLLVRVLRSLEGYYGRAAAGETEEIYENWNRFSLLTDERVEVDLGQERVRGRVIRIDRDGALVIEKETGGVQRIMNGDVSLRRRRRA